MAPTLYTREREACRICGISSYLAKSIAGSRRESNNGRLTLLLEGKKGILPAINNLWSGTHTPRAAAATGMIYSSMLWYGRINHILKFTTPINKIRSVSSWENYNFCSGVGMKVESPLFLRPTSLSLSTRCSGKVCSKNFSLRRTADEEKRAQERPAIVIKRSTYCPWRRRFVCQRDLDSSRPHSRRINLAVCSLLLPRTFFTLNFSL